jgi:hypothetical protein
MWESGSFAFPCAVNSVIHDGIACYVHYNRANQKSEVRDINTAEQNIKQSMEAFGGKRTSDGNSGAGGSIWISTQGRNTQRNGYRSICCIFLFVFFTLCC